MPPQPRDPPRRPPPLCDLCDKVLDRERSRGVAERAKSPTAYNAPTMPRLLTHAALCGVARPGDDQRRAPNRTHRRRTVAERPRRRSPPTTWRGACPGRPAAPRRGRSSCSASRKPASSPSANSYERPFTFRGGATPAIAVASTSSASSRGQREPGRYIVVTAHFDHLGVRNGQVFNGADDNASGVAALLAVAARISARQAGALDRVRRARRRGVGPERRQGVHERSANSARRHRDEHQPRHGGARCQQRALCDRNVPIPVPEGVSQGRGAAAGQAAARSRRNQRERRRLDEGLGSLSVPPGGHPVHLLWRRGRSAAPQGDRRCGDGDEGVLCRGREYDPGGVADSSTRTSRRLPRVG